MLKTGIVLCFVLPIIAQAVPISSVGQENSGSYEGPFQREGTFLLFEDDDVKMIQYFLTKLKEYEPSRMHPAGLIETIWDYWVCFQECHRGTEESMLIALFFYEMKKNPLLEYQIKYAYHCCLKEPGEHKLYAILSSLHINHLLEETNESPEAFKALEESCGSSDMMET